MRRSKLPVLFLFLVTFQMQASTNQNRAKADLNQSFARIRLGAPGSAWHMHALVLPFANAQPAQRGTMDIIRTPNGDTRTTYTFPNFHQTVDNIGGQRYVSGNGGDAPAGLAEFANFLVKSQLPANFTHLKLETFSFSKDKTPLRCIAATVQALEYMRVQDACRAEGSAALRFLDLDQSYSVFYSGMTSFQSGDVPSDAVLFFSRIPVAQLKLTFSDLAANEQASVGKPASQTSCDTHAVSKELRISEADKTAAVLLRLTVDDSKVIHATLIAATDKRLADKVINQTLNEQLIAPGCTFVNFLYNQKHLRCDVEVTSMGPGQRAIPSSPCDGPKFRP